MNINKFFERAKERGVLESQVFINRYSGISVSLFRKEIDSFDVSSSQSILACGIYEGKFGVCSTERFDNTTFDFLIDGIIDNATSIEKENKVGIFKGSEKYKKWNVFNKQLPLIPLEKKIETIKEIENSLLSNKTVSEVGSVSYSEDESIEEFYNSFGLKLKSKNNIFSIFAEIVGMDEGKPRTAYNIHFGLDYSKFDKQNFVDKTIDKLTSKFGGNPIKSGKYKTVLDRKVFSSLIGYFLSNLSAEEIQKHSSFLEGKLGQKVASKKLTIEERPLDKTLFYRFFDHEGVATKNKMLVEKGVIKTYLYNRETALADGTETTGNARLNGGKFGIGIDQVKVKGSKITFDQLISNIKNGVYITEVQGLGTGMNEQSGDFSCQAQGFSIVDGKIDKPLTLITLSGNLLKMLNDIVRLDNQVELHLNSIACPNVLIKSMSIGGE